MKKLYATIAMAMMAMSSMAQEQNDTTYVMFDFNLNPWNYPVTTAMKGWSPDYDEDDAGAIYKETDFTWPIAEGSDKLITVTVYPVDLDEFTKPAMLARFENYDVKCADEKTDSVMTMLFTYPGTTMRFRAPEGYKFAKMLFYDYRNSYFLLDTEEAVEAVRFGTTHLDTHKIWVPTTPKVNQNQLDCWEGDETNILFNNVAYFKGNFLKIDMRLVSDGTSAPDIPDAISEQIADRQSVSRKYYDLQGRKVSNIRKGIYVADGKKVIR